jgi:hypothetical protein
MDLHKQTTEISLFPLQVTMAQRPNDDLLPDYDPLLNPAPQNIATALNKLGQVARKCVIQVGNIH